MIFVYQVGKEWKRQMLLLQQHDEAHETMVANVYDKKLVTHMKIIARMYLIHIIYHNQCIVSINNKSNISFQY